VRLVMLAWNSYQWDINIWAQSCSVWNYCWNVIFVRYSSNFSWMIEAGSK